MSGWEIAWLLGLEVLIDLGVIVVMALGLIFHDRLLSPKKIPLPVAIFIYIAIGIMAGLFSLYLWPALRIHDEPTRILNLIGAPIAAAVVLAAISKYELKEQDWLVRRHAIMGGTPVLLVAAVRYLFAKA